MHRGDRPNHPRSVWNTFNYFFGVPFWVPWSIKLSLVELKSIVLPASLPSDSVPDVKVEPVQFCSISAAEIHSSIWKPKGGLWRLPVHQGHRCGEFCQEDAICCVNRRALKTPARDLDLLFQQCAKNPYLYFFSISFWRPIFVSFTPGFQTGGLAGN